MTKVDVTDPEDPAVRVAAADVSAAYDGEGHGISVSVTVPASGTTVEYARAKDGPWQADAILFTNACATTKVWYRVLADGYAGVTNAASVTVTPRAISSTTVTLSLPEMGYKDDGTVRIDGLGGEALGSTELVIPETIGGVPVTEVKEGAFMNSTCGMETLKLAKYCRKIGARAFHGVRTLQRVAFVKVYEADGVTEAKLEIGAYAFGSTGVSSLVVPDDVQEIGDYAFSNCGSLKRVSVGPGTTVSPKAFYRSGITAGAKPEVVTLGAFAYDGATETATMTVKGSGGTIDLSGLKVLCWTSAFFSVELVD